MEDGCGIVCGVGERTEFRYDGVRSEFVLRDFPGMMVGNCVPLQYPWVWVTCQYRSLRIQVWILVLAGKPVGTSKDTPKNWLFTPPIWILIVVVITFQTMPIS